MATRPSPHQTQSLQDTVLTATYPAVAGSVRNARHALLDALRAHAVPDRLLDDIGLALSEACTNAVLHSGGTRFTVLASFKDALLRVSVSDDGGGMVPRSAAAGLGLGLSLIAASASGVVVGPCPGGGTQVAMKFDPALL